MTRTDTDDPNLRIGITGFEAIASRYFTRINLEGSGFNIDRHNFAMVAFFDLRPYLSLIDCVATLGKFFFAVAGLSSSGVV
jgi:hypothetical protein